MGIFDFFRSKKETGEKRKIKFEEIGAWLSEEKKKELGKEAEILRIIENLISQLCEELKEEREAMQKVDISKRKEPERVKVIVLENLSNYSSYVEKLVKDLEKIERKSLEGIVNGINSVFFEFAQKSRLSFEKARFLVGKELGKVQESIDRFFRELKKVAEENKPVIQNLKLADNIEKNLMKIEEIEQQKSIITKNLDNIKEKIANLEEKRRITEKEIEKTRNSENYLKEKESREQALSKRDETEKEILNLNRIIDFKSLKKIFHDDEKKMRIIKDYENDPERIFGESNEILNLISKEKIAEVSKMIEKIRNDREESDRILSKEDSLHDIESELEKTKSGIKDLDYDGINENAKIKKMKENIDSIKKSISESLEKMNASLFF